VCGEHVHEYWSSGPVSWQYYFYQRRCEEQSEDIAKLTAAAKSAQKGMTTGKITVAILAKAGNILDGSGSWPVINMVGG